MALHDERGKMIAENLDTHILQRPSSLLAVKEQGRKIVGYLPGGYVPEELIYAAGAIPLCLCEGGSYRAAEEAISVMPGIICPFARSLVTDMASRSNPFYKLVDLVVAPITCQHLKEVAELWEYRGDVPVIKLGVPHQRGDLELEYFCDRLKVLSRKLGEFTGNEITTDSLERAITLYDRMRKLISEIGSVRKQQRLPITTKDFVKLNHASFYADPEFMVNELERLKSALDVVSDDALGRSSRPRLLLMGPNLAHGDTTILDLVEAAGGDIVVEEFFEGMRCSQTIESPGDPYLRLAQSYLRNRLPPAFMRVATAARMEHAFKLIDEFKVSGVVWYELLCCETYDQESYVFFKEFDDKGIPILIIETDYGPLNTGALKTRVGAFMEILQGGSING
jgi:benzoyl-CoA reductase/2-hydroxyglutaryl-CoA dehydratase subunit BcrC/BadD/HgdB